MSDRIKILHVMESLFSKGGTPRKLLSLVDNGDKDKFLHVFLVFHNHPDNLSDELRRAGAIVEEVSRPKNYDIRFLFDIRRMVRKYKVNIVNTHFARSDIYGMVAGLLWRIPVIKSVHGIVWNNSALFIYLDRLVAPFRHLTTCNSHASLAAERARSGVKKAVVVHNGVIPRQGLLGERERKTFRRELSIPDGAFVVGHVGGLIDLREQHIIIDAASLLIRDGANVCFLIAGDGPEREKLENRIRCLGIGEHVKMLGYRTDISRLQSIFDVYVNMATEEGFGIAVVEAMFANISVVLANSGALPELIVNQESGVLVPPSDATRLAEALSRLASDPGQRKALAQAGQDRARKEFSIKTFVSNIENIFLECAKKSRMKDKA